MKFLASQKLDFLDSKGKKIIVEKGEVIPKEFRRNLLLKNRNFISDLDYKDGIPVLTKEEEKEYELHFGVTEEQKGMKGKIKGEKYTQEKLNIKLNELGDSKFKDWAESEFGKKINKKRSAKSIISKILKLQEESKR